jgi:hypothetical protein
MSISNTELAKFDTDGAVTIDGKASGGSSRLSPDSGMGMPARQRWSRRARLLHPD